jgi:propionate CoA-transferase
VKVADKLTTVGHILRWRLSWDRCDLDYRPAGKLSECFRTAREAARLIPDGATVISCGMAANARCSTLFWAVREEFMRSGSPAGLTWISVGGQGGRGRVPGTVEEIAQRGLLRRFITGHAETCKAQLALAEAGELELHVLPQGEMTRLLQAQAEGLEWVASRTGIGTFLDPRVGRGSAVTADPELELVEAAGDALRYTLPPIDVAMFSAPYADAEGNVYFRDAATITENLEAARAARANGGRVLVVVAALVPHAPEDVSLPAAELDAVVVNPRNEQTGSVAQKRFWRCLTPGGDGDDHAAIERLRFINRILGITPRRGPVEQAFSRLGAVVFAETQKPRVTVNIGVGFGEEVCRVLYESRLGPDIVFTTETGVYGGLPAPGIFFGAAVNPQRMHSSAWMFRYYERHLDVAILGFLQVDSAGNVNVSRRGNALGDYVGPGGFPSIIAGARTVIFIGAWMAHARWRLQSGLLHLAAAGAPKFVDQVDEITFNGREGLKAGKRIYYVTHIGVLRLTEDGLELDRVMPGVDIERDVHGMTGARIRVPAAGPPAVVPASVVSGHGFELRWGGLATTHQHGGSNERR